ncbi:LANO_0G03202g1_1 [Lachancea nothofagi CBS 11611]|uniref:LANO_0G03202g1_1 n=1 Tax=Lachancea nothofagi CBS 11611 TaxID=1266666 RepID=A0A1G4KFE0_9SACH|nr:LANO_0G03202g1_1 [Lachancea nothofagi CBS 11611]
MTVENIVSQDKRHAGLKKCYELHLVPCKIGVTGPTKQLEEHFQVDAEESHEEELKVVTYIRGRKIIGKPVPLLDDHELVALEPQTSLNGERELKVLAKVSNIYNYEREGNEKRLQEEMLKFEEFLQLAELIHGP